MTLTTAGHVVSWDVVAVGDIVLGGDGRAWTFMERLADGKIRLETDGKPPFVGAPSTPTVTLLSSAADQMELAEAVTTVHLGGVAHARRDTHGNWTCPVEYDHPGSLAGHIYVLHGKPVPNADSIRDLLAVHHELHRPENKTTGSGYMEHVHTPDFGSSHG